ncbi:MAG: tRNA (adenosine(37)-N6)-threonylcarbamoyltransferase complex dimerization subunit type 1 TsaB [Oricola sp.]
MLTLAIDTAANFCSCCLWDGSADRVLAAEERDIGRGHAEQLMDVVDAVMKQAGREFADIERIAVAVGPGSFTGIRVGVAAARGFGLALGVHVTGVTTLEALAADARMEASGPVTVTINGGRGQVFVQSFDTAGNPAGEPEAVEAQEAASAVSASAGFLAGNAARDVAASLGRPVATGIDRATGAIATIARLSTISARGPVPLYLRGADAKPQEGFALPRAATEAAR